MFLIQLQGLKEKLNLLPRHSNQSIGLCHVFLNKRQFFRNCNIAENALGKLMKLNNIFCYNTCNSL
ncbi:hypothetical protein HMPREF9370_1136 [Neisseria wadsworthii 9715]|uniref:Uncharacterized protein n=1 Tax=Neisseria wadsworthii 9715 TaxID=1030841 RepID=G4CPX6_9NEIS|nr:hypothetical protein HMPREF9370_1136 [Neisseria wadsworthii 9715]